MVFFMYNSINCILEFLEYVFSFKKVDDKGEWFV